MSSIGRLPPISSSFKDLPVEPTVKSSPISQQLTNLPSPSFSSEAKVTLPSQIKQVDALLIEELDAILKMQEKEIEGQLTELEKAQKGEKTIKTVLKMEKLVYEKVHLTKDVVKEGIEFLEKVIPKKFMAEHPSIEHAFEDIQRMTLLSALYLKTLDIGAETLALFYKVKILSLTREVIINLQKEKKELQKALQAKGGDQNQLATSSSKFEMRQELKKLEKVIKEMKFNVEIEDKNLEEKLTKLGLSSFKHSTTIFKYILSNFSLTMMASETQKQLKAGVAWLGNILSVICHRMSMEKADHHFEDYHEWTDQYETWKKKHKTKGILVADKMIQLHPNQDQPLAQPIHPSHYAQEFFETIRSSQSLEELSQILKKSNIKMGSEFTSYDQFIAEWNSNGALRERMVTAYIQFQREMEFLDAIIQTSEDLLKRRKARDDKKIVLLRGRFEELKPELDKLKHLHRPAFDLRLEQLKQSIENQNISLESIHNRMKELGISIANVSRTHEELKREVLSLTEEQVDHLFNKWIASPDVQLRFYVDRQSTIEQTTKNALKEMVNKKHEIEGRFLRFELFESQTTFALGGTTLVLTVALTLLTFLALPAAGIGTLLSALAVTSAVLEYGFMIAGFVLVYLYRLESTREMFRTVSIQLLFANLANIIENYRHGSNKKRVYETALALQVLRLSIKKGTGNHGSKAYNDALAAYEKAKLDFAISESKVDHWKEKAKKLQNRLTRASWQDFAHQAGLQVAKDSKSFDSLIAFQQALQECDFSLLSTETKELLEVYLGLNLEVLQGTLAKNPHAIKGELQKFFNLESSGLAAFITQQKARIKAGLIHSTIPLSESVS